MLVEGRAGGRQRAASDYRSGANKVADITLAFWVIKICATTLGETGGDLLSMTMSVGYALSSLIFIGFFALTLVLQLRARSFHPSLYWAVILSTSTAGTTISDFSDRTLGWGYAVGSTLIATLLVAILIVWRLALGNLRVDHIADRRVELFYWLTVLASNTLGTALGDFLADSSGLGYGWTNLLISSGIALVAIAYFGTRISRTALFWIAFVLTRPFGATMGDLLTKPVTKGGLDLGTIGASLVLFVAMVLFIVLNGKLRARQIS